MSIRAKDEDILNDFCRLAQISATPGSSLQFRLPLNKGWQLQFDLDDPDSGAVKNVDIVQIPLRQR